MEKIEIKVNGVEYVRKDSIPKQSPKVQSVKSPYVVGQQIYIETVTKYYAGTLVAVTDQEFVLEDAAWIADTGRFHEFCVKFNPTECEPCGNITVGRGGMIATKQDVKILIGVV